MEIRTATTGESETVVDMWVELASDQRAHGSHLLAAANRRTIRESIAGRIFDESVLVATVDEDIVGFVMFTVRQGRYRQDVTQGSIENIYVRPGNRGRGIGSALLSAAEGRLADDDVDTVTLEMMASNEGARRFYQRHGYTDHRVELEKSVENDTL
ncbi:MULTISPECIES: GNAT family N-acetyltransferase [Haloarcula]|uniref:GNAT family N-acetyltransferase n=1 Tax=Haloarcula TaxID=2237 RepID=UPI0023EDA20E|nr:GNAT family N-acetyltransferase [Halomicroarcula sp. XH51]